MPSDKGTGYCVVVEERTEMMDDRVVYVHAAKWEGILWPEDGRCLRLATRGLAEMTSLEPAFV